MSVSLSASDMDIACRLFALADEKYKSFQSSLVPNVQKDRIIGVRIPKLRQLAKSFKGQEIRTVDSLSHHYYEENLLCAILISGIADFDTCIKKVEQFLPYVDNWAVCDSLRPRCFAKNENKLLPFIDKWLSGGEEYTVRFALEMLMLHFLDDSLCEKSLYKACEIHSEKYYVNMMIAWLFATALAKNWDVSLPFLTQNKLSTWVHNKTVQKAVESLCITQDKKEHLKTLRRKL